MREPLPQPFLASVVLTVTDMNASLAFYRGLGIAIPDDAVWAVDGAAQHVAVTMPNGVLLELDSIAMTKSYYPDWTAGSESGRTTIIISMPSREAVDATYADATASGHRGRVAPFDAFWGARYAVVFDPDGNDVGLMSPMEEARQSAPPKL